MSEDITIMFTVLSFFENIFLKNTIDNPTNIIQNINKNKAFFCENKSVFEAAPLSSAEAAESFTVVCLTISGTIVIINAIGKKKSIDLSLQNFLSLSKFIHILTKNFCKISLQISNIITQRNVVIKDKGWRTILNDRG